MEVINMIDRKRIKTSLENRLKEEMKNVEINGRICFATSSGGYIRLDTIGDEHNCIVIEYADDKRDANNNVFEDGDLLYINEMTEEEMLEIIKREIEED